MIVALAGILGIFIGFWVGLRVGVHICDTVAKFNGIDLAADTATVNEMKKRVGYESEL